MIKQCIICGKEFHTPPSGFNRRQTCSRECSCIIRSRKTKGRPKSAEHRKKIGLGNIGKRLGYKATDETRKKLSDSLKGIIKTPEWREKIGLAHKREKGSNWKGGRTEKRKNTSFKWVKVPGHPHANGTGFIRRYRYVMEQHIGRYLEPHEVVHHINEDPTDDRIENLMLFNSQSDHAKHHANTGKI